MSRDNDMRNRIVLRVSALRYRARILAFFFMTSCKAMRLNALLILLLSIAPASAQEAAKPIAVVNGVRIEQQAFDQLLQQAIKQGSPDSAQLRGRLRDQLIARELFLLARQCGAAGLSDESRRLFELAREASGEERDRLQFRVYRAAAALVGWTGAGKLSRMADRLR